MILILVASMTGTAEFVAEELQQGLLDLSVDAQCLRMEAASVDLLMRTSTLLLCSSTFGAGDVPENGKALYAALASARPDLSHLRFGVVALGDSGYVATFCGGAERFASRLVSCGAQPVGETLRLDARATVAPEEAALAWLGPWLATLPKETAPG